MKRKNHENYCNWLRNTRKSSGIKFRDSDHDVIIANGQDHYLTQAEKDGFKVMSIEESIRDSEVILLIRCSSRRCFT